MRKTRYNTPPVQAQVYMVDTVNNKVEWMPVNINTECTICKQKKDCNFCAFADESFGFICAECITKFNK